MNGRWLVPLLGALAGAFVTAAAALGGSLSGRGAQFLLREPQDVLLGPWYAGAASLMGGLLWWTAAVAALALVLAPGARRPGPVLALVFSVLVTMDDLLRLHEDVLPRRGLPEKGLVLGYLLLFAAWAWVERERFRGSQLLLPLGVLGLLGASAGADLVLQRLLGGELPVVEDGAKLVGAGLWAGIHVRDLVARLQGR